MAAEHGFDCMQVHSQQVPEKVLNPAGTEFINHMHSVRSEAAAVLAEEELGAGDVVAL